MKIKFTTVCNTADEDIRRNEAANARLGLPDIGTRPVSERLAVIGGAATLLDHVREVRGFNGERWAINGAFRWCSESGLESTFFTVDARPEAAPLARGARRAVLALRCDQALFSIPQIEIVPSKDIIGPSSATTAALAAINRGHKHVSFFGCSSSYDGRENVASSPIDYSDRLLVRVRDRDYLTNPGLLAQAELLAEIIRAAPSVFADRSGGLLSALVECSDYDIIAATENVHRVITCKTNGQTLEAC